ncbi:hypothetical protein D6C79_05139 [Aureobasidium pullulans]|nr:hypothetical protein D6C79_05139 [Aureobasidium pullulans]
MDPANRKAVPGVAERSDVILDPYPQSHRTISISRSWSPTVSERLSTVSPSSRDTVDQDEQIRDHLIPSDLVDDGYQAQSSTNPEQTINSQDNAVKTSADHGQTASTEISPEKPILLVHEHPTDLQCWNPIWLRKPAILAFAFITLACMISVVTLYLMSESRNGLGHHTGTNHYTWRYGPTAVITIVVILWSQLDRSCKLLAPWHSMSRQVAPANRTVCLDYLFAFQPVALYQALRLGDWAVLCTGIGSILLKLSIVVSTGLLLTRPATVTTSSLNILLTNDFQTDKIQDILANTNAGETFTGIHTNRQPYPNWTTGTATTQSFITPDNVRLPSEYMLKTSLNAFMVGLMCEVATMRITPRSGKSPNQDSNFNATIESRSCTISVSNMPRMDPTQLYDFLPDLPAENFVSNSSLVQCENQGVDDERLMMFLTMSNQNLEITNSSAIICRPDYTLGLFEVEYKNTATNLEDEVSLLAQIGASNYPFNPEQRMKLNNAIYNSTGAFLPLHNSETITEAQASDSRMFNLMTLLQGRDNSDSMLRPFLNADIMTQRATQVFSAIGVQTIAEGLLVPRDRQVSGQATFQQQRLVVDRVSATLMSVAFGLICSLCVVLIFVRPWNVVQRRPASAAEILSICMPSTFLRASLQGSGHLSDADTQQRLTGYNFSFEKTGQDILHPFVVEVSKQPSAMESARETQEKSRSISWWHPWGTKLATKVTVILLPLACIAVLQFLQAKSNDHHGFVRLPNSKQRNFEIANYATQYLPAAIMVSTKLLFGGLEDVVNVFAPFVPLKNAHKSETKTQSKKTTWLPSWLRKSDDNSYDTLQGCSPHTLGYQVYGRISFLALISAVKRKYWAVVFVSLTALLSPFLTIIVSGLYTLEQTSMVYPISTSKTTTFNLTWPRSWQGNDDDAGLRLIQIWDHNASYPLWTYGDVALPKVDIEHQNLPFTNTSAGLNARLNAILPGVKSRLDCVPTSNRTVFSAPKFEQFSRTGPSTIDIRVPVNVLNTCLGHRMPNMLTMNLSFSVYNEETYVAQITNVHISQPANSAINVTITPDRLAGGFRESDNGEECPSLAFYIAKWSPLPESGDYQLDFTALSCRQVVDEVQVNTTLLYPTMELDPQAPPVVLEGVTTNVVDATHNGSVKTWQVGFQFDAWDSSQRSVTAGPISTKTFHVSRFYQMVVNGSKDVVPIALDDMIGDGNIEAFSQATKRVYGMYMAQVFSGMKQDLQTPVNIQATIEAMTEWRVLQHEPSKIVLQIILAIMAACGILTWIFMDTKEVLPHNPCTIAGMASLFADSSLWAEGASKEMFRQDLNGREVFGNCGVSLGWHDRFAIGSEEGTESTPDKYFGIDKSHMPNQ